LSSILRALKKLDEDPISGEQETGAEKIKMKRIVKRRAGVSRVMNRRFFIVPAVLLLGAAAWIVIDSNKQPLMTKKQDTSPGKPALTHLPRQVPILKKELPGEAKPAAVPGEQSKRPAADKALAEKTNGHKELIKETKHPGFILNGILWSANADRRVALINDRYLKEGDSIDGVLVVKIEKAAVILQSGEETWTLRVKKK
jgi:hypothetical protein